MRGLPIRAQREWLTLSEFRVAEFIHALARELPERSEGILYKTRQRVVGIGGDVVKCCGAAGEVTVNGVPLDEPYA
ncbi:hypothetical protein ACWCYZ_44815, partial [Streptomyces virginiae]